MSEYNSKLKSKKAIAILKNVNGEISTLSDYDFYMSLSESTLDKIIKDLDINIVELIPQMDFTFELQCLYRNINESQRIKERV